MINNLTANGTMSINTKTNSRTYCLRQKQYGRFFKILLLILVMSLTVYFLNSGLNGNDERLIYQPVIVQDGDTLWELAENTGLHMETRRLVLKIMVYNSLANSTIIPGQTIYVPISI